MFPSPPPKTCVYLPMTGRRGLLNLGQTCFLNAVLQCFAHNPLLRNFFLSDKHNWKLCKAKNCTCCEMDKFFTEVGSHSSTGKLLGPIVFRSTQQTRRLTALQASSRRRGGPHMSWPVTLNVTPTNSSFRPSTRFTLLPVDPRMSPATALSTQLLQDNCRAM